ncbi:S1 family peptidase [Micromonospora sp. LAH09]|uniref:S1 family peptidase n=1 Tax=Micromonospora cabrerizensis TaxID=2911213 RepID=UPI001EE7EA7C|nr:S1 family peptidase [Micromonospora cabrerizensis]MCG5472636.1 S1 family peptidase [Micromonospora cabrerizensis]
MIRPHPTGRRSTTMLRRVAVAAFGLTLLVAGMTAAPATAAPGGKAATTGSFVDSTPVPGGFASWTELLRLQQRMNTAAARITNTAERSANSGFAGVVADPTTRQLQVYWKGEPPANLVAVARSTVATRVLPAPYSQRELVAAADRLRAAAGDRITTVGPRADGAGLLVGTQDGLLGATALAGVPVTVQTGVAAAPATRWDDTAPWWGGAAWRNTATGGGCSTGFGVFQGGVARMLSAAHCANLNVLATDPTGQTIGIVGTRNTGTDTLLLAGSSGGRVFNNSTNAAGAVVSEFSNQVIGAQASQVGNFVCTSGAYSGTRCSIQVKARNLCINVRNFGTVCGQVQAESTTRTNAVGQGDSGGPVEIVNPANTLQVWATGTNTAIDDTNTVTTCTGYVTTGRVCAWRMYYEDIFSGMAGVGASGVVLG